jgi:hypothetical protein
LLTETTKTNTDGIEDEEDSPGSKALSLAARRAPFSGIPAVSLSVDVPGGGAAAPKAVDSAVTSAVYRQFGLVLGQLQAGDERGAVARIRANLRSISGVSTRPDGWDSHSKLVEEYIRGGKTEVDPPTPTPKGPMGALDPSMLSAEHRRALFPAGG